MNNQKIGILIICLVAISVIANATPIQHTTSTTIQTNNSIELQKTTNEKIPVNPKNMRIDTNFNSQYSSNNYPVPNYEFITQPSFLMNSYYDYMPGSYSYHPLHLQTDHGNGLYLTFFGSETGGGTYPNRDQYYAYVNSAGSIQNFGKISSYDKRQGYGSIAVHPATGDAIASWHEDNNGDGQLDTTITYDNFDAAEIPGVWQQPLIILQTGGATGNQYVWPYMYVGPSPQGTNYVRVYQITSNNLQLSSGNPCEDIRIMYTDIPNTEGADLSSILSQTNWQTVTVFTDWRDKSVRPFQSFAIDYNHPGKVAFIGYAAYLEGNLGNMPVHEGAFVWESLDYGASWDYTNLHNDGTTAYFYKVLNPGFETMPSQLEVSIGGYHNTAVYDNQGNLHWTYLQSYGYTDSQGSYYLPYFMPQAEIFWDGNSFSFHEIPTLQGTDSLSGHSVPWTDIDHTYPTIGWSTYPAGMQPGLFQENTQKQAINKEKNWIAQIWTDGTYHQLGTDGNPQYVDYVQHPLIYISVSPDNGITWSEPLPLTDVHNQLFDFSNQITVYPFVCDQITDLGDNWGQLYLYYYNDNEFGSSVQGAGSISGGSINYCSIKIQFPTPQMFISTGGPYNGELGDVIQFTGSARGGTAPYTWSWDFGDGTTSTEQNPIHAYTILGKFQVSLIVTDSSNPTLTKTDITTATIIEKPCTIDLKISGGTRLLINVTNTGDEDLTNIHWNVTITGGLIIIPREKTGTMALLAAGDSTEISLSVFGFGFGILKDPPRISVEVGCANISAQAKIFLKNVFIQ
jgi:PKD repeat protein